MLKDEAPQQSRIDLPPTPADLIDAPVAAWSQPVSIDTYHPADPDAYPAFLDNRVYQGSSGKVYPLPFHERIASEKHPHLWQAVHLENKWVRLMLMPELGGRIHIGLDKATGYDFFYRNNVIKPALVGLAGPWISGGVEFNWPQHHRPGTYLPTDWEIEHEADGAVTVWFSDHDPFTRMKGMHGIRLRPDSSRIEARVRLYNRTEKSQTFLWWANVAAAVGDDYQSFFPTDVHHVADHAKRAVVTFPRVSGDYYGVDYPARVDGEHPDADRLDWYRNIPVPTSYMVTETAGEFFGGYDHGRQGGFVHVADRHVSPGKKQWTWGNAPFGWAWDRNLTDTDGPYVELMAGVYTDNQPDFAYLAPGETKTFSQFWYPIQQMGPAHVATDRVAARLDVVDGEIVVWVLGAIADDEVSVRIEDEAAAVLFERVLSLRPSDPTRLTVPNERERRLEELTLVITSTGHTPVRFRHPRPGVVAEPPTAAVEPPAPADVDSIDELFFVGSYLAQYRHATRAPEPYWQEALNRDPGESRAMTALGWRSYTRGLFDEAFDYFTGAVERQTRWVPTPVTGEALYGLGLTALRRGELEVAADRLGRAAWDDAYAVPATFALARIDARRGDHERARERLEKVIALSPEHLQARDLLASLTSPDDDETARSVTTHTLGFDPLDQWARSLAGRAVTADARVVLDIALEFSAAGQVTQALAMLDLADRRAPEQVPGDVRVAPLLALHRALLLEVAGRPEAAATERARAAALDPQRCFPSGLDDLAALTAAVTADPTHALAWLLLGHWYYDAGRHADAIDAWARSSNEPVRADIAVVAHRNLGIAAYNVLADRRQADEHYRAARALAPDDARLLFEADQLAARCGASVAERLAALRAAPHLVTQRDDLAVTYATLLTQDGRADEAKDLLTSRTFQPWEGGEGQVLNAWEQACLTIAGQQLQADDAAGAVRTLEEALDPPENLGEARHLLVNDSGLRLALGDALAADGRAAEARRQWRAAASFVGDFANMATRPYSRHTVHSVRALRRLGEVADAAELLSALQAWLDELETLPASIDYFATSLPTMLLFIDDPQVERDQEIEDIRRLVAALDHLDDTTPAPNRTTTSTQLSR